MPGRNLTRLFAEHAYYHVYNRGVNKQKIFLDQEDYEFFLSLFGRYVSDRPQKDSKGREYHWLGDRVEVLAYCIMPNHFHLLLYQNQENGVSSLLLSIGTAYVMYFNKKYKRRGPLFENTYRCSLISNDTYLQHISRYIHLNPRDYKHWPYSSLTAYLNFPGAPPGNTWLHPRPILDLFDSVGQYKNFVNDYEAAQRELETIKHELADY